jgi:hypothetical protein
VSEILQPSGRCRCTAAGNVHSRPLNSDGAFLESFSPSPSTGTDAAGPRPLLPHGFFVEWGGWLGQSQEADTIGNFVHALPPFEPGGFDVSDRATPIAYYNAPAEQGPADNRLARRVWFQEMCTL